MKLYPKKLSRRHFLLAAPIAALGYMRFGESGWLEVGRHEVRLTAGSRKPLTLLHLSDLHASSCVSLEFIEEAVELALQSCKPDLVCLTGDFITTTWEHWDGYAAILGRLTKAVPAFACLGNHDGGRWAAHSSGYADHRLVEKLLAKAGVSLLHNAARPLTLSGWQLNLVGVGDLWAREIKPDLAFSDLGQADATIVLSHNPDTKTDLEEFPWDLMLCGHTHGGQLSLPAIGTPFAPVQDKAFVAGLHRWKERWLHITKGVGNLHGMRFNCRPEVSVLALR